MSKFIIIIIRRNGPKILSLGGRQQKLCDGNYPKTREKPGTKKISGDTTGNSQTRIDEKTLEPKCAKDNLGPVTAKQEKPRRDNRDRRRTETTCKQIEAGYQPIQEIENIQNELQMEEQLPEDRINDSESAGENQIIRVDYLPIVNLKNYNTEGQEAQYVQFIQIIGAVTEGKKIAEETIKRAKMDFMLDLKV